ncbi:hypothetical protein D9M71_609050 [compost metagenome]
MPSTRNCEAGVVLIPAKATRSTGPASRGSCASIRCNIWKPACSSLLIKVPSGSAYLPGWASMLRRWLAVRPLLTSSSFTPVPRDNRRISGATYCSLTSTK